MDYRYNVIILSKQDTGEADRMYVFYSLEAGKTKALAASVRKPNSKLAGSLEPITQTELFIARTKGSGKITNSIVTNYFKQIKTSPDKLRQVFFAIGYFQKIIHEQEKDSEVFELLKTYLESVDNLPADKVKEKINILTLGFLFKVIKEAGYEILLDHCSICNEKIKPQGNYYFSSKTGGLLCANCQRKEKIKIPISIQIIKILRIFLHNKLESLLNLKIKPVDQPVLRDVFVEFYRWIVA